MLVIALTINIAALIWALIFFSYPNVAVVLGLSAVVWFFVFLYKKQKQLEASFKKRFTGKCVLYLDKHAVLKAQRSRGYSQAQGMGYLVLTETRLDFEMQLLNRMITINVKNITQVGQGKRLLGVGTFRPMLIIDYIDNNADIDSLAFTVNDIGRWQTALTKVIQSNCHNA